MNATTASEIARLETMTITKVVERFESLFGEKCRSRNKRYLIRRIAWRLQANAEGDLSERAKARAAELALDSEVRVTPPRETIQPRLVTSDVQSRPALDQRLSSNETWSGLCTLTHKWLDWLILSGHERPGLGVRPGFTTKLTTRESLV